MNIFNTYNCGIFSNIHTCTFKINFFNFSLTQLSCFHLCIVKILNKNLILTSSNFFRFLQVKLSLELRPALLHSLSE